MTIHPRMFLTFGKACLKALRRLFEPKQPVIVSHAEAERRIAICAYCPQNDDGQCKRCLCAIPVKVWIATEECPDGKWGVFDAPSPPVV